MPRVVPIVVHLVGNIHQSNAVEWIDGHGNQAGFRCHDFQPKGTSYASDRVCLFRYIGDPNLNSVPRPAPAPAARDAPPAAAAALPLAGTISMAEAGSCSAMAYSPVTRHKVEFSAVQRVSCAGGSVQSQARRTSWNGLRILGTHRLHYVSRPDVPLPTIPRKRRAAAVAV